MKRLLSIVIPGFKAFLFVLTILYFPSDGNAQTWCPPGATWHYDYNSMTGWGYWKVEYTGDSIVDGIECKVLSQHVYQIYGINNTFQDWSLQDVITYQSNDSVFYKSDFDGEFYLLYDFGAMQGDQWTQGVDWSECGEEALYEVEVLSTDELTLNGSLRRELEIDLSENSVYGMYGEVVEGIGCIDGYLFPSYFDCLVEESGGHDLRCYYDDEIGFVDFDPEVECEFIISVDELSAKSQIKCFPNPANDILNFDRLVSSVDIFDLSGRHLRSYSNLYRDRIDIAELQKGSYILILNGSSSVLQMKE